MDIKELIFVILNVFVKHLHIHTYFTFNILDRSIDLY